METIEINRSEKKPVVNSDLTSYTPGAPGSPAKWTSSAKSGVGTALSNMSHVWFTLSHGIFNEVYYPHIDKACIRDMGFIVTDGKDFFSEEKREADSKVDWLVEGVPAFKLTNTCRGGRYLIEKEILTDPYRDTVLQKIKLTAKKGKLSDYQLYILLSPHLGNQGGGNTAWVGSVPCGKILRIETMAKAVIHWSDDDWKTVHDLNDSQYILGIHFADLPTKSLSEGKQIKFTFYWPETDSWEGTDFVIQIGSSKQVKYQ